jgi:hypothetical protein
MSISDDMENIKEETPFEEILIRLRGQLKQHDFTALEEYMQRWFRLQTTPMSIEMVDPSLYSEVKEREAHKKKLEYQHIPVKEFMKFTGYDLRFDQLLLMSGARNMGKTFLRAAETLAHIYHKFKRNDWKEEEIHFVYTNSIAYFRHALRIFDAIISSMQENKGTRKSTFLGKEVKLRMTHRMILIGEVTIRFIYIPQKKIDKAALYEWISRVASMEHSNRGLRKADTVFTDLDIFL